MKGDTCEICTRKSKYLPTTKTSDIDHEGNHIPESLLLVSNHPIS